MANDFNIINPDGSKEIINIDTGKSEKIDISISNADLDIIIHDLTETPNISIELDDLPANIVITNADLTSIDIAKLESYDIKTLIRIIEELEEMLDVKDYLNYLIRKFGQINPNSAYIKKTLIQYVVQLLQLKNQLDNNQNGSGVKDEKNDKELDIKIVKQDKKFEDEIRIIDEDEKGITIDLEDDEVRVDLTDKDITISSEELNSSSKKIEVIRREDLSSLQEIFKLRTKEPNTIDIIDAILRKYEIIGTTDIGEVSLDELESQKEDRSSRLQELFPEINNEIKELNRLALQKYLKYKFKSPLEFRTHHKQIYNYNKDEKGNTISSCIVASIINLLVSMDIFSKNVDLDSIEKQFVDFLISKGYLYKNGQFFFPMVVGYLDDNTLEKDLFKSTNIKIPNLEISHKYSIEEVMQELMLGNPILLNTGNHALLISGVESDGKDIHFLVNDPLFNKLRKINSEDIVDYFVRLKDITGRSYCDHPAFCIKRIQKQ